MTASKKKKKKKALQLLLLVAIFGICLGGYLALSRYNRIQQEAEATTEEAEKNIPIDIDRNSVVKIEVRSKGETGNEVRSYAYNSDTKTWEYALDTTVPVKQSLVNGIIRNAASIQAIEVISENLAQDGADFGLQEPEHTVTLTLDDGTVKKVYIGSKALTGDYYYFAVEEDSHIYLMNSNLINYAARGFYDFVDSASYPSIEEANMISIRYQDEDKDMLVYYNPEDLLLVDAMSISMWYYPSEIEGRYTSAGYEAARELVSAVTGIYFSECVKYHATDAEMAEYGLDAPIASLTVTYNLIETVTSKDGTAETVKTPTTFTLHVGASFEKEEKLYYYVSMDDEKIVYAVVAESGLSFLLDTYEMDYMLNKWPCQLNIVCVDSFTVTYQDMTVDLRLTSETETDENGKENTVYTFYVNDRKWEEDAFRILFGKLIMVRADKIIDPKDANPDSELILEYEFTTVYEGEPTKLIQIGTYNDTYYQMAINGEVRYLVTRVDAKEVFTAVEKFMSTVTE